VRPAAHVHVAPANRGDDVAAVNAILDNIGLRRRGAARPAVVCSAGHPLGWLLSVGGQRVFVAHAVRVMRAPALDEPLPRLTRSSGPAGEGWPASEAWQASGEWGEVGDTRLYDWLDDTATVSWGVECDCGPAEIRRAWLVKQAATGLPRATLPTIRTE
jgi:hypothetical protein